MDISNWDRPFYSWTYQPPDIEAELLEAMEKLSWISDRHKAVIEITPNEWLKSKKRFKLGRVLGLFFIAVTAMLALAVIFLVDRIRSIQTTSSLDEKILSIEQILQCLQLERATTLRGTNGHASNDDVYLHEAFTRTDKVFNDAMRQSAEYPGDEQIALSMTALQRDIWAHRAVFPSGNAAFAQKMSYYSKTIDKTITVMLSSVPESTHIIFWKSLVVYQKLLLVGETLETESLLRNISFVDQSSTAQQNDYIKLVNWLLCSLKSTFSLDPFGYAHFQQRGSIPLPYQLFNIDRVNGIFQQHLLTRLNSSRIDPLHENDWSATMAVFKHFQEVVTASHKAALLRTITDKYKLDAQTVGIYIMLISLSILACPILVIHLKMIMTDYDKFTRALSTNLGEHKEVKARRMSLLCQTVPPYIVNTLSRKRQKAELFNEVTILFADIHGVSSIISRYSPVEVVSIMDCLFKLLDERIDKYDAFRMEIVGESYMISSGVPRRNTNHVTEIANLALDLVNVFGDLEVIYSPESRLYFQLGIHTGPCVAALFGIAKPRYRLIGETVGIASRMEMTGLPNRIQISSDTSNLLSPRQEYMIRPRGLVEIKNNKKMFTHWLIGRAFEAESLPGSVMDSTDWGERRRRESIGAWSSVQSDIREDVYSRQSVWVRTLSIEERTTSIVRHFPAASGSNKNVHDMTMEDLEYIYENKKGSPPILQLTEGVHY